MPVTWRAYIDSTTAQMEEEIRTLKRKSKIGEIGLKATEERCTLLERNVRLVQITLTVKCCQEAPGRPGFIAQGSRNLLYNPQFVLPF